MIILQNCSSAGGKVEVPQNFMMYLQGGESWDTYDVGVDDIKSLRSYAFYQSPNLRNVVIPGSVQWIPEYAFAGSSIYSVTMQTGANKIDYNAFYNCTNLSNIVVADDICRVEANAFRGVDWNNLPNCIDSHCIYLNDSNEKHKVLLMPAPEDSVGEYVNDLNATVIAAEAFKNNTDVQHAIIDSALYINHGAFQNCTSLTSIQLCSDLTELGQYSGMIDDYGSYPNPFAGCSSLNSIQVYNANETDKFFTDSAGHCLCERSDAQTGDILRVGTAFGVIPSSVTVIGGGAFSGQTGLTSITIPSGVTSIGHAAFSHCTNLQSVSLPSTITNIDYYVFMGCSSLTSITIPENIQIIYGGTFKDCTSLTSISIPSDVSQILSQAFYQCSNLTSVTISSKKLQYIGNYAFGSCHALTDITFTGDMSEWNAINKDSNWDYDTDNYTIHCKDGDIPKQ